MTSRSLKIALALSVALNLFAIGAGATLYVSQGRIERQAEAQAPAQRDGSPMRLIDRLSAEERPRIRAAMRASALAARPDFEVARDRRREAIALATSADFDPVRLEALLTESREADQRGRARLERDTVALLGTVSGPDRVVLAEILKKRRDRNRSPGNGDQASPPSPVPAAG